MKKAKKTSKKFEQHVQSINPYIPWIIGFVLIVIIGFTMFGAWISPLFVALLAGALFSLVYFGGRELFVNRDAGNRFSNFDVKTKIIFVLIALVLLLLAFNGHVNITCPWPIALVLLIALVYWLFWKSG